MELILYKVKHLIRSELPTYDPEDPLGEVLKRKL